MINNWRLGVLALAGAAAGCGSARSGDPLPLQGVVELDETVLGFELGGRVARIAVREGDRVDPNAVLASLDDSLVRASRAALLLRAEAARSQADLVQAGARREDVSALQARVRAARATEALLEKNLARQRALLAQNAVSAASLDEIEGQYQRASAERQSLDSELASLLRGARREERAGANSQAEAAKAELEVEDERLERHVLHAPATGRVLDLHVEPGEVVAAGTPIVTLGDTKRPYVEVFVPEAALGGIDAGDRASVRVDAYPQAFSGRVEHVSPRTEFTPRYLFSDRERPNLVVRVRVRVDDPEERLHAGVPAFVTVDRASQGAKP